jgi:L-cysteine desulfidase
MVAKSSYFMPQERQRLSAVCALVVRAIGVVEALLKNELDLSAPFTFS